MTGTNSSGYIDLSGFSRGPDGLRTGSGYTANHALHGSLGNDTADGFWHELRNPVGVPAGTGSYLDKYILSPTNGQWLPNGSSQATTSTGVALHVPGDTHPADRAWQVAQGDALRDNFDDYLRDAQARIRVENGYAANHSLSADEIARARASAYHKVMSRDVVGLQNFQKAGLANEYDPANPDRPFMVLHNSDPRLARANAARAALGQPPLVVEAAVGLKVQGHNTAFWNWSKIQNTNAAKLGILHGEAIDGNIKRADRVSGNNPLDPRSGENLSVEQPA